MSAMIEVGSSQQRNHRRQLHQLIRKVRLSLAGHLTARPMDSDATAAARGTQLLEPVAKSATVWGLAWLLLITLATADADLNGAGR